MVPSISASGGYRPGLKFSTVKHYSKEVQDNRAQTDLWAGPRPWAKSCPHLISVVVGLHTWLVIISQHSV
jgi:hypothetical protein